MRGEQSIINQMVLEHPKCPIKETINGIDPKKLIEVIEIEYWNEWRHLLNYAETTSIFCTGLGKFYVSHVKLRSHMWHLLTELKKMRWKLKNYTYPEDKKQIVLNKKADYEVKFRACWKQWEEYRRMFILRTIRWNNLLISRGTPEKIKYHYEGFNFSFVK